MIIAIDYDDTYTHDPRLWLGFIRSAQAAGHRVVCATLRYEAEGGDMCAQLRSAVQVFFTGRKAKAAFLKAQGVEPHIWIDDSPAWIVHDFS
jgi:hypothetical protein